MSMTYDYAGEFRVIERQASGSRFWKVDLHLHSPASHDFRDKDVNEYKYVEALIDRGLDLVAVTDHGTGEWVDKLKNAAKAFRNRDRGRIVVLPGAEICASGVHLLALLPEAAGTADIEHLLSRLGILPDQRGTDAVHTTKSPVDVIEEVHRLGGLAVGAHCHSDSGAISKLDGQTRIAFLQRIDALEVKVGQSNPEQVIRYVRENLGFENMPFVRGSDAHSLEELTEAPMWVRMGKCSFAGLSQIVLEPDLRIRFEKPPAPTHPAILGMSVSGGIYAGTILAFNGSLNTIIGPRASGKSALIDLIRWTMGMAPWDAQATRLFEQRIAAFLEGGHTVRLYVRDGRGRHFIIERTLNYVPEKRGLRMVGEPRVLEFLEEEDQVIETPMRVREVFDAEVFGQGEVLELTKRADNQLRLIDEYAEVGHTLADIDSIIAELQKNRDKVVRLREEIEEVDTRLSIRAELERRRNRLESELQHEVFKTRDLWLNEKGAFAAMRKALADWRRTVEEQRFEEPKLGIELETTPSPSVIAAAGQLIRSTRHTLIDGKAEQLARLEKATKEFGEVFNPWQAAFEKQEQEYQRRIQELGFTSQKALANELASIRATLSEFERVLLPRRKELEGHYIQAMAERAELLGRLDKAREALWRQRSEVVAALTSELGGSVRIELEREADVEPYIHFLETLFEGSGIQSRGEQLARIADKIPPRELSVLIREKKASEIATRANVTAAAADRVVQFPPLARVLDLETVFRADRPRILLRKRDEYEYTELDRLSLGEKCSAVLSIALLNKRKPLIIDQPEDEVDYAFVSQDIVHSIRKVKDLRQLILATHNANIPVLGDADLVLKLRKRPGVMLCEVEAKGSVDEFDMIKHLMMLEGGPEAFRKRNQKYHRVSPDLVQPGL